MRVLRGLRTGMYPNFYTISTKREATLLVLERYGVNSQEMKERILRKVFPTRKIIEAHLESQRVRIREAPKMWEIVIQLLLAQGGSTEDHDFKATSREQE